MFKMLAIVLSFLQMVCVMLSMCCFVLYQLRRLEFLGSRFWAHLTMTYVFSMWTCYTLYMEYKTVANMRLRHLASESRRPDQLTVSHLLQALNEISQTNSLFGDDGSVFALKEMVLSDHIS